MSLPDVTDSTAAVLIAAAATAAARAAPTAIAAAAAATATAIAPSRRLPHRSAATALVLFTLLDFACGGGKQPWYHGVRHPDGSYSVYLEYNDYIGRGMALMPDGSRWLKKFRN